MGNARNDPSSDADHYASRSADHQAGRPADHHASRPADHPAVWIGTKALSIRVQAADSGLDSVRSLSERSGTRSRDQLPRRSASGAGRSASDRGEELRRRSVLHAMNHGARGRAPTVPPRRIMLADNGPKEAAKQLLVLDEHPSNRRGLRPTIVSPSPLADSNLTAVRANLGVRWRTDDRAKRVDLYSRRTPANDRVCPVTELNNRRASQWSKPTGRHSI